MLHIFYPHAGVMGCGAVEATDLGFVCFLLLSTVCCQPTDFGLFCFINIPIPPPPRLSI